MKLQSLFEKDKEEFEIEVLMLVPISLSDLERFQDKYPDVVKAIIINHDLEDFFEN